jgi:hypothetical protein
MNEFRHRPTHNNQIKKETVCYTPACEWPAAIVSQACAPQTAPIITGVMCFTGPEAQEYPIYHELET